MSKKILLVEDMPDALDNLRDLLLLEGYHVITAVNGHDAFDKLKINYPDLIITDVRMPGMDGFQLLSELKASGTHRDIPVIVFSADAIPDYEQKAIAMGAKCFLNKMSSVDQILDCIREALA